MRAILAAACSLVVLAGCGGGEPEAAPPSTPGAPNRSAAGVGDMASCTHPAGFRVSHPADWSVNEGAVLPVCSWFAEESFAVPEASGVRTADIVFSVRPAEEVPARWPGERSRSTVHVDGRAGVRVEEVTTPGLYPAGIPLTTYVLDLPGDRDVLVADTIGLAGRDYVRNVAVLDAMVASIVWDPASAV